MSIQNIHQVSDVHPTVEMAMEQLSHMLDEILAGLDSLFEVNGGSLWGVEAISHHVLTVPGESKRIETGLLSRTEPGPRPVRGHGHAVGLPQQRRPQVEAHSHACSR